MPLGPVILAPRAGDGREVFVGVVDFHSSRTFADIITNIPSRVRFTVPDVHVGTAAAVVTFPAVPIVARPTLLVGPMPAFMVTGSGHDDVAPRAAAARAALDTRREV